jgi:CRP-like cAMP-binding protein/cytochrome P450
MSLKTSPGSDAAPLPPVCPGTWLLGNARALLRDTGGALKDGYERCGPVFRLRAAWRWYTIIAGAEATDFMAQGLDKLYLSRHRLFSAVHEQFGPSPLVLRESGAEHARLRPPLAIAYSRQAASPFVPALIEAARRHAGRWSAGTTLSVVPQVRQIACAQYCEMLGPGARQIAYRDGRLLTDYMMSVAARLLPAIAFRAPWYRAAHKRTYGVLRDMVRAQHQNGPGIGPPTILETLATVRDPSGTLFTDEAVVSYGAYGIGASCGYVGRLAAFMFYEILRDPALLAEIVQEVQAAFASGLREATDVRRMRILRSVYDETLRFHPIALGMPFNVDRDFTYRGHRVRKGDFVVISPVPTSFSPETFRDPYRFDAARCREPRNEHRRDGACQPFGLGDRTCVAMGLVELMAMTMVATLVHDCELAMAPPEYQLRLTIRPLPAPNRRFRMRLAGRRAAGARPLVNTGVSEEQALATFPGHDEPAVQQAVAHAIRRRFAAGTVIVREGELADAFYLLTKGSVTVTRETGASVQPLAELGEGDWFGEVGLLQNAPRSATVTAGANGADTLVLDREAFLGMVATSDLVAAEMGQLLRKRVAITRLRQAAPSLTAKAAADRLPEFGSRVYQPGQTIITRGDAAEEFFVLVDGEVDVSRPDTSGVDAVVARLGPGDYFGEIGLLQGTPRNATVTAAADGRPVLTLVMGRAGFERLLAEDEGGELARAMLARVERLAPSG